MCDEENKKEETPFDNAQGGSAEPDDVVEFGFNEDGEEDLKKTLKKLRADLKEAKKEKEEYLTGWQKERADFANYKKDEESRKMMWKGAVEATCEGPGCGCGWWRTAPCPRRPRRA